jgi:Tfp pilus assembly protein PilF
VARLLLARALIAERQLERAEAEMKWLLDRYPQVAAVHSQHGLLLLAKNDRAGARAAFTQALQLDPNSREGLGGLVTVDMAEGKQADARRRVERRLAVAPDDVDALLLAARVYMAEREAERAEATLRRAIQLDPARIQAYGLLGGLYLSQRRLDQARAEFEAIAARQPHNVAAQTMTAMILQAQGKLEEARQRYERIVEAEPRAAVASNNLAWMYAEKDTNLDLALQLAQAAKAELPDVPEVNDTLGFVYLKKNLHSLAVAPLRLAVERDPQNPLYRFRLGLAYAGSGNKDAARRELQRALEMKPDFPGADEARRVLQSLG